MNKDYAIENLKFLNELRNEIKESIKVELVENHIAKDNKFQITSIHIVDTLVSDFHQINTKVKINGKEYSFELKVNKHEIDSVNYSQSIKEQIILLMSNEFGKALTQVLFKIN